MQGLLNYYCVLMVSFLGQNPVGDNNYPDNEAKCTKHRSQVIVLPVQKVSQTLVKANLRPKNFCF